MDKPIPTSKQASANKIDTVNGTALLLFSKVREQIELAQKMVALVPNDKLLWQPAANSFRVGDLLGHLLETLAGFCAALFAVHKRELSHFARLRDLPVNHCCGIEEATCRLRDYRAYIEEGFAWIGDEDLTQKVPTIFTPDGEAVLTILLGNLEHLINHKHQLFFYLKLLGVPVSSRDLYQFRDDYRQTP
jgi:hypothetical protein